VIYCHQLVLNNEGNDIFSVTNTRFRYVNICIKNPSSISNLSSILVIPLENSAIANNVRTNWKSTNDVRIKWKSPNDVKIM